MNKYQAMTAFFESFGLDAYEENSLPTSEPGIPSFPYLTYPSTVTAGDDEIQLMFSIWYRSPSLKEISEKALEISQAIGFSTMVYCDEGAIIIRPGDSFIQGLNDENDPLVKRKVFTVYARFLTEY